MKKLKKVLIVLLCTAAVIGVGMVGFKYKINQVIKAASAEYNNFKNIDLSTIPDGIYNGIFGSIPVTVDLDVTVKEHRIENVTIKKQSSGKGYEATETTQRIVNAQNPKVDVVTGATLSSKCIMVAAYKALQRGEK